MLVEEFKRCIHSDITCKSFLDEKQVETLEAAARLADDYALTHKDPNIVLVIHLAIIVKYLLPNPSSGENKDQNPLSQPICNYC